MLAALKTAPTGRAIELDAIRGLAIILAMGWHLNRPTGVVPLDILLLPGWAFGWAGVDIFFVLSGFLIGGIVLREIDRTGDFQAGRFLVRRAFRLWPVLYLYLLAQLFVRDFWTFFPQVFFHLQNYLHTPLVQLWSLAIEEQFYLAVALVLPWVARKKIRPRTIVLVLVTLAISSTVLRTAMWFAGEARTTLQWETQYRLDGLIAGVLLALVKIRRFDIYERLQGARWPWFVLALGLAFGLSSFDKSYQPLLGFPQGTLLGAALILGADGIRIGRFGRGLLKPIAFMGLYSYSMYIWHIGIGRLSDAKVTSWTGSPALGTLAAYAVVIIVSVVITRAIERPMIELRNRLFPATGAKTPREASQDEAPVAARAEP